MYMYVMDIRNDIRALTLNKRNVAFLNALSRPNA